MPDYVKDIILNPELCSFEMYQNSVDLVMVHPSFWTAATDGEEWVIRTTEYIGGFDIFSIHT